MIFPGPEKIIGGGGGGVIYDIPNLQPQVHLCPQEVNAAIRTVRRSKKFFGKLKAGQELFCSDVWLT